MFTQQLNIRKCRRSFNSPQELEFGFVSGSGNHQANGHLTLHQLWSDGHDVDADWHDFFQVHKHLGPIETPFINDAVDERSAFLKLRVFRLRKKLIEFDPPLLQ